MRWCNILFHKQGQHDVARGPGVPGLRVNIMENELSRPCLGDRLREGHADYLADKFLNNIIPSPSY